MDGRPKKFRENRINMLHYMAYCDIMFPQAPYLDVTEA
jgi:hypothetical protein